MTPDQRKKARERFYAEEAAKLLGKSWIFGEDREHPDFIVTEGAERFGLEVRDIFAGKYDEKGSQGRVAESATQRAVDKLRSAFEATTGGIPVVVRLVGDMCAENIEKVLAGLVELDIQNRNVGYQGNFVIDEGPARLIVHVTRSYRADWFCVNDRAGGVHVNPVERIAEEIAKKAQKLPNYRVSSGLDDIRLLLVANRIMNSGKLAIEGLPPVDPCGFRVVYFLSYPESAVVLGAINR